MTEAFHDAISELRRRELTCFIGPRPGKKSLARLADLQLTHCCTLLSEREGARAVKPLCDKIGVIWVWLPIEGGKPDTLRGTNLSERVETLVNAIADEPEPRLYLHCSAGIHRTGFFFYLLRRLAGKPREEAVAELEKLRAVTAEQVGTTRIDLADDLLMELMSKRDSAT